MLPGLCVNKKSSMKDTADFCAPMIIRYIGGVYLL